VDVKDILAQAKRLFANHSIIYSRNTTRCVIITGTTNFRGQNLVNMGFICTKISGPRHEILLHEMLPELCTTCTAFTV